ncbi:MAG: hypothetical protein HY424_01845 [Candidatus Levybacteria bacterium]|nr:hypothetical protein [Candidatus Levybacteria bacterium]
MELKERSIRSLSPESCKEKKPPEVYAEIFGSFENPRKDNYLCRPLTSGWAKALTEQILHLPASEKLRIVMDINNSVTDIVTAELVTSFSGKDYILPEYLWPNEFYAMTHWFNVISGLRPEAALEFFETVQKQKNIDIDTFNNHEESRTKRSQEYQKLLSAFTKFVASQNTDSINTVSMVILLPGHEASLGCKIERQLAQFLKVPLKEIVFDEKSPRFQKEIVKGIIKPFLTDFLPADNH